MTQTKQEAVLFKFNKPLRAAFMNAVDGKQFEGKGDLRYDATLLIAPDDPEFLSLKALVIKTAQSFFPGKKLVPRRLTQEELDRGDTVEVNVPWKDGTREADKAKAKIAEWEKTGAGKKPFDNEAFRGQMSLRASSKYQPALAVVGNGKVVDLTDAAAITANKAKFYPGAYYLVGCRLNPYAARDNKPGGVGLFLNNLVFVKDGPKIGGQRASSAEVFKGYIGSDTTEDPTQGAAPPDEF